MSKTVLIVATTRERARCYAEKYGYEDAHLIGSDVALLRGSTADKVIIVGRTDDYIKNVVAPIGAAGAEILYAA